jgi:hypothetical protein
VPRNAWLRWPRSLFARLMLILLLGILAAQAMSYVLVMYERGMVGRDLMLDNLEKDVTSSVAILDRVPAANAPPGCPDRPQQLPLPARRRHHRAGRRQRDRERGQRNSIANAVDKRYNVTVNAIPGDPKRVHMHLRSATARR